MSGTGMFNSLLKCQGVWQSSQPVMRAKYSPRFTALLSIAFGPFFTRLCAKLASENNKVHKMVDAPIRILIAAQCQSAYELAI